MMKDPIFQDSIDALDTAMKKSTKLGISLNKKSLSNYTKTRGFVMGEKLTGQFESKKVDEDSYLPNLNQLRIKRWSGIEKIKMGKRFPTHFENYCRWNGSPQIR